MICVVVLQICLDFVEGTTGSCGENCVTGDVDGTEEISINPLNAELNPICHLLALLGGAYIVDVSRLKVKVEEAIDINDEMQGAVK
jgi:hypothetical protein